MKKGKPQFTPQFTLTRWCWKCHPECEAGKVPRRETEDLCDRHLLVEICKKVDAIDRRTSPRALI